MQRRTLLQRLALLAPALLIGRYVSAAANTEAAAETIQALDKAHEAWRSQVSADAYAVLFEENTERSGSSPLNDEHRDGTFVCAACYLPLFDSASKFNSGTGWPSFTQPIAGHVGFSRDFKLILPRTEYHCARCGGHQGHRFDDGPAPRNERWCNNGLALNFIPKTAALPALRS
ncbi:MAG: peptide-methionine (R)-S-oxide reductase MsrB [Pseudomonadaceae bacterium]|jgi:peptide-methionine (R)-S-oxide reductase|nr:peptide-methionine (R)-S-oxide reductase MsrB [Pseudomonadaceae bacterium]